MEQLGTHRPTRQERFAHVSPHHIPQPAGVLTHQRPVESQLLAELLQRVGKGRALSLLSTEDHLRHVAGNDTEDDKGEDGGPKECGNGHKKTSGYVLSHGGYPLSGRRLSDTNAE